MQHMIAAVGYARQSTLRLRSMYSFLEKLFHLTLRLAIDCSVFLRAFDHGNLVASVKTSASPSNKRG